MERRDIIYRHCKIQWKFLYLTIHITYNVILGYIVIGPVIIVNLQDITTQNDLEDNNAVFTFDMLPRISPDVTLGYRVEVHWRQVRMEFGGYHGTDTYYLPPKSVWMCGRTPNATLELVGPGSFKLTVPTSALKPGPLSISVSVSLVCLQCTFYCHFCTKWSYISQMSNSIKISAKRGTWTTHCMQLSLCLT